VHTRLMLATVLIGSVGLLAGCNGPTKAGKEARSAAQDRMNVMSAQVNYDQARQSFETGQFEKAHREIRAAIARFDKSAEFYLLQGRIYLETHQLENALESFKTAMTKKENYADPHYFAGIVYQRWSDDEQAYESYRKAYELAPTKAQYLLAAAESLIALGELDAASDLIAPRLDYFEHNSAIKQLQGQIALLKGDAKKATVMYAEARLLDPDNDMLLEDLMWAQYAAEMYGQCHESAKRLQERAKEERFDFDSTWLISRHAAWCA
jgi:Tfp pilus assembly protein PilF